MTININKLIEKILPKYLSLSKKKHKPLLKELNHIRVNQVRYHSIKSREKNANSSFATSVEKEKDIEIEKEVPKPETKKKSKFFKSTNKLIQISNEDELLKNKIKVSTTRNLPIITAFDNMNIDKTEAFYGEQNNNDNNNDNDNNNHHHHHHHHKTKKHYKLKTHNDNTEIKEMDSDNNNKDEPKTKKFIEVL